jgi:hypothetical protein
MRSMPILAGLGVCLLAKHIAGAELYYTCIDPQNYRYRFELWLYRDCTDPTGANYDDPIRVYVFRGNGSTYADFSVSLTAFGPWQPGGIQACFLQTPQTCLEEGVYRFEYTLPAQYRWLLCGMGPLLPKCHHHEPPKSPLRGRYLFSLYSTRSAGRV